jgi:MFS family permease
MLCAGASELSVSQWSSLFAEKGLGLSKTMGDIAGPMFFAIMMGCSRVFYGKHGDKIDIDRFTTYSSILCIFSYLFISLIPSPVINLLACGTCGMSVGIMWPGTFSKASATLKTGGTAMFALLALAGDLGCSAGPTLVGLISDAHNENIKLGILVAILFPVGFILTWKLLTKMKKKSDYSKESEGAKVTETDVI